MKRHYTVSFWQSGCTTVEECFTSKREAQRAIAEFIYDGLRGCWRIRSALKREGSAYRDGSVVVKHKAGGREFGAYIN